MKKRKLCAILVFFVALAMMTSAFAYVNPIRNEMGVNEGSDEHPWGGEVYQPGGGGTSSIFIIQIGNPLSLMNFFQILPYLNTRNDIPLIRGNGDLSRTYRLPSEPNPSNSAVNQATTYRGN